MATTRLHYPYDPGKTAWIKGGTASAIQRGVKRIVLILAGAATLIVSLSVIVDLLVVTEEERLDIFVEHITDDDQSLGIDHALDYVDPNREDVRLSAGNESIVYSEGEEADLANDLRGILSEQMSEVTNLVQKDIAIKDNSARVGVRIRARQGLVDAVFEFKKHEDGWLLKSMRIS